MTYRIVVALEDERGLDGGIGQHFGGSQRFLVAEVDRDRLQAHRVVDNPHFCQHKPGAVPVFVARDLGASAVIVGGIGARAAGVLGKLGIEVASGFSGTVRDGIEAYLRGERHGAPECAHGPGGSGGGCGHGHGHGHGRGGRGRNQRRRAGWRQQRP
jgi:predicted Fe-Mo cluster-binding NifX family protein